MNSKHDGTEFGSINSIFSSNSEVYVVYDTSVREKCQHCQQPHYAQTVQLLHGRIRAVYASHDWTWNKAVISYEIKVYNSRGGSYKRQTIRVGGSDLFLSHQKGLAMQELGRRQRKLEKLNRKAR